MPYQTDFSAAKLKSLGLLIIFLLMVPYPASASSPDNSVKSPLNIEGVEKLDAEGVIILAGNDPNLIIVDSRIPDDRKLGYIEGSISLPNTETTCESLAGILPQKDSHVLFYCNGVKCGRSAKAIVIAKSCGYTDIYWFRGGFEEWLAKGYPYLQE